MQDVISQLAENPAYKILLLRRKKEIEILDALSNSKDNVINVAGKMKLQQELRSLAIWMSWFPWILGMLILQLCWSKVITLGVLRILMPVFTVPSALENTLVSDRKYPMLPTSVYGNKIVGYEDAMRTITQEMVVECSEQLED
jgi:hypothetical protein